MWLSGLSILRNLGRCYDMSLIPGPGTSPCPECGKTNKQTNTPPPPPQNQSFFQCLFLGLLLRIS